MLRFLYRFLALLAAALGSLKRKKTFIGFHCFTACLFHSLGRLSLGRFARERFVRKAIRGRVRSDASFVGIRGIISFIQIYRQSIEFAPPHPARVELIVTSACTGSGRFSAFCAVF